ncbi:MAG: O-antigen ligase family protein [Anaerolineales bacterium]|nr:O-antigen ligase family protein [Anaerolineales bacterium]
MGEVPAARARQSKSVSPGKVSQMGISGALIDPPSYLGDRRFRQMTGWSINFRRLHLINALFISLAGLWHQHRGVLLRLSALVTILLTSVYLAPRIAMGNRMLTYILLLYLGAAVAVILLKWPPLGLVALVAASLYVPFSIGTGTAVSVNISVLLVGFLGGLWLLDMLVRQKRITFVYSRPVVAIVVFVLVAIIAFGVGLLPLVPLAQPASLPAQIGGLAVFILSALVFLLVTHQVDDLRWLQAITWVFLGLGAVYIAGRLIPALGTTRFFQYGAHGSLFWIWMVALAFSQAFINKDLKPFWRLALIGLVFATLYVGFFQGRDWASGWAPGLVAVIAIIWLRSWRLGLVITLVSVAGKFIFDPGLAADLVAADQYSIDSRAEAYRIVLELARANPLLGLGMSNYYHYTPLIPIWGYYVPFNSHSQYIDLIAQTGLIGLGCFFWFVAEVGRLGWRLRTQVSGGFATAYVYGALGGLAGMLVAGYLGDWVLPFVYNIGLIGMRASLLGWMFLGGLLVIEKCTQNRVV